MIGLTADILSDIPALIAAMLFIALIREMFRP